MWGGVLDVVNHARFFFKIGSGILAPPGVEICHFPMLDAMAYITCDHVVSLLRYYPPSEIFIKQRESDSQVCVSRYVRIRRTHTEVSSGSEWVKSIIVYSVVVAAVIHNFSASLLKHSCIHRGSTGPAEYLLRTTPLQIWPPLISL